MSTGQFCGTDPWAGPCPATSPRTGSLGMNPPTPSRSAIPRVAFCGRTERWQHADRAAARLCRQYQKCRWSLPAGALVAAFFDLGTPSLYRPTPEVLCVLVVGVAGFEPHRPPFTFSNHAWVVVGCRILVLSCTDAVFRYSSIVGFVDAG
ncbi:MAG: hypothetical protein J2P17_25925 [Mycobacterium sp.]|nr:hypothetical protein [Mycobacterium sp.]